MGETKIYDALEIQNALIADTIKEVATILEEKGYNPINQIVGYLMSGDPGYISSYKDSRDKILEYDRSLITAVILEDYLSKNK